ncbi:NAD-binding protein [Mycobacterium koreense]|uniref:RCK N-terminal domain-containing protein n=1 Tax=Mycolicibacillus koreensis TaxID=1069220 RepID=A0A7I7SBG5_9MYCO|nr:NAD-binding protein [Mycolicibacillus koreensis]MCV7246993.1 NAD-binding protein [Mycolicibacillus koreensis]OSC35025.1 hypothetical protein B8W67_04315 [Mycolicibacillus koreensis]BBY53536.1 hypothetical protein MKOR_07870 [Mycolicibacillus koreensis]
MVIGRQRAQPGLRGNRAAVHRRVLGALTDPRWYWLLIPAGLAAFALGFWGYGTYAEGTHSVSDAIYGSVKLFLLSAAPQPETHVGVALNIARFLAPTVAGWATLIAIVSVFRERVQQMLIPFKRGHVVVCGLGYVGFAFVQRLRDAGYRVVVIERDDSNPQIKTCREWGFPVIVGDAQLPPTLTAAGTRRAARLLAVTPDSVTNTEIVACARHLADATLLGRRRLRCLARITDPGLSVALRIRETNRGDDSTLDFFNIEEIAARMLLDRYPVTADRPHLLVAHLDTLGARLVIDAARRWHDRRSDPQVPLRVTVVDDDADRQVAALRAACPPLDQVCEFSCVAATAAGWDHLAETERTRRGAAHPDPPVAGAFVTARHDDQTVRTALALRQALGPAVPVVAALSRAYAVADLLEDAAAPAALRVTVFRTLAETCSVELVEGGSFESIAQEIHRRYCLMQPADATPPSWADLDAERRRSSRSQARHIGIKLRSIGCEIAPLRDWAARDFRFTDDELVTLSIMEHDRWQQAKQDDGWTLGPKSAERKTDPHLVPWHALPAEIADWDRRFVLAIPEMLAAVGLQIVDTRNDVPRYPLTRIDSK